MSSVITAAVRGVKVFANSAALIAGSADYGGQPCVTSDGVSWSIARSTTLGETILPLVNLNSLPYVQALTVEGAARFNGTVLLTSPLNVNMDVTPYADNCIYLTNFSGGYASITGLRPEDASGNPDSAASFTLGYGPGSTRGSPGQYNDRVIFALAAAGGITGTSAPPDWIITQEGDFTTVNPLIHVREKWDGTTRDITWYAASNVAEVGAIAMFLKGTTGQISIGGNTPTSGKELTVEGDLDVTGAINGDGSALTGVAKPSDITLAAIETAAGVTPAPDNSYSLPTSITTKNGIITFIS